MMAWWSAVVRALNPSSNATGLQSAIRPSAISGAMTAATRGLVSRAEALVSARWVARVTSVVVSPSIFDGAEVVTVSVLKEGDELDAAFGVDYFA